MLSARSAIATHEYEPLRDERAMGYITQEFRRTSDLEKAGEWMTRALRTHPLNILHCIDIVPLQVTGALIEAALAEGYTLLLLTSRDEAARQSAVSVAEATSVWGPKEAERAFPKIAAGQSRAKSINLKGLKLRLRNDLTALGYVTGLLQQRGAAFDWLFYEDLFGAAGGTAARNRVATKLGLAAQRDATPSRTFRDMAQEAPVTGRIPNFDAATQVMAGFFPPRVSVAHAD
ncbi:hypothetical protein [Pseudooceanicola nanhaiensis]|uniref:hypothetical protein n=1 Tax=Pseudooceanicola nanhaiensis TaxID=375761 RepID=UPI001CD5E4AE|nr:hypothetical protein [Pseudooceanicola nanhaiensis]MCA0922174.1 hypothetical protein [Pseudooceanicola nanhaiensis]